MEIEIDPIMDLKYTRDQLALEFFSLAPATAFLKKMMDGIISSFSGTKDMANLPDIVPLDKNQTKFIKVLHDVPYTEIGELRAYVPEGMSCKYLDYLHVLLPVTKRVKSINSDLLQPFTLFLAQLVSDKNASVTTNSKHLEYNKMEHDRDEAYKHFAKLYDKNSYKAETLVKKVIDRNADWTTVFHMLNECTLNVKSVDRELIKRQIQQCTDYLNIINDNLSKDQMANTTKETAARLSNGAYQVAKQLEEFSTVYYRVLAMNGSIENTTKLIIEAVG